MGQRQRSTPLVANAFKYKSHVECEESEDAHVVTPTVWPPRRHGRQDGDPSVPLQCMLCGAWCIVYRGHETGQMPGIRVILPEPVPLPDRTAPLKPEYPGLVKARAAHAAKRALKTQTA